MLMIYKYKMFNYQQFTLTSDPYKHKDDTDYSRYNWPINGKHWQLCL